MNMKELIEFLFEQMEPASIKEGKGAYYSVPVDANIAAMKNDFVEYCQLNVDLTKIQSTIINDYRMLYYQKEIRRFYAFSTMSGATANIITDEVVLDMEAIEDSGIILYTPDPYYLTEKGFTRESFQEYARKIHSMKSKKKIKKRIDHMASFKSVVGYFVYTNKLGEASVLDLTNIVITLYKDTEMEKDKLFIKHIIKHPDKDLFLCSGYSENEDNAGKQDYWYIDVDKRYLGSINERVAKVLGHWDFEIYPGSFDLFAIWDLTKKKTLVYSYSKDLIYNEFDDYFKLLNILSPREEDYANRTIILLYNHDIDREGDEDILGVTPLSVIKEEDRGRYVPIHKHQTKIFKKIHGLDILYTVVENPDYVEEEDQEVVDEEFNDIIYKKDSYPYIFSLMYMDEDNQFVVREIPTSSIPVTIYASKKSGIITLIYSQNVMHNVVSFFKEYYTLYKYSYIELSTSGVRENKQRKLTMKILQKLRDHLLETSTDEKTYDEEFRQMHTFINARILDEKNSPDPTNDNPIISSSYFIDLTNMVKETDVTRLFINPSGRFMDIQYIDRSISSRLRIFDPDFDLEETAKKEAEDIEWVKKMLKGDKK